MIRISREDNGTKGRFVLFEEEVFAGEMTFTWAGDSKLIIDHTEVQEAFSGKGYAKQLVLEGVRFARERKIKIIPLCSYARHVFDKDSSLADVLA